MTMPEKPDRLAQACLSHYELSPRSTATLINYTENSTYRVDDPASGNRFIFRIYRVGYHDLQAIESELAWMSALRRDAGVQTPEIVPARDGSSVLLLGDAALPEPRFGAMFTFLEGAEPPEDHLSDSFGRLGEVAARMHLHSRTWSRPAGFKRPTWNFESMLGGPRPIWGRWQDGIGLDLDREKALGRLVDTVARRLERFGSEREQFGLVHADLRLANLLIEGDRTKVIDFDDCGFGWYMYDLSTALTFIEERADVPELVDAWVRSYRRLAPLTRDAEDEIPTFMMLRRVMVMAWIASHSDTDLARSEGTEYTLGTCRLASRYLDRFA
jgi:Ser/Thr protein kinase RdoA (MazF antagonist)